MLKRIGVALGTLVALAVLAEITFQVLPVSSSTDVGYRIDPDILTYPPHHVWRVATGWDLRNPQTLRSNNFGFATDRDFTRNPAAVALIGDSYVEASMLAAGARPAVQLEARLKTGQPVYAMGGPGSSLLDYVNRIRWAHDQLGIRSFVVMLEQGDVRQVMCGSGNVHSACLDEETGAAQVQRQPPADKVKQILRHSAFAQYLVSQLKIQPADLVDRLRGPRGAHSSPTRKALRPMTAKIRDAAVAAFFHRLGPFKDEIRIVLLVDGPRGVATPADQSFADDRAAVMAAARAWGARVVDATELWAAHGAKSKLSLEVGPYDRHLNGYAVGLLMAEAARQLQDGRQE